MLGTPILFMVFNRPEETARVLQRIVEAAPKRLFVSADGPRPGHPEDESRCASVRALIDALPPNMEVQRLFRTSNLGCKRSGVEALTWFFSRVDRGIILEDDCLPDPSFFRFCESALERYENEERVMLVSGHNPFGAFPRGSDAVLSKYPFIWGWASWSRAWKLYNPEISNWDAGATSKQAGRWLGSKHAVHFWMKAFRDAAIGAEVWDYQISYVMCMREALAVVSSRNLVSNIGFGASAVHTGDPLDPRGSLPLLSAPLKLKFPGSLAPDAQFERRAIHELYFNRDLTFTGWAKKVLRRIRKRRESE